MSSPSADRNSSRDVDTVTSTGTAAPAGVGASPLGLLAAAGTLFFAVAAALLASAHPGQDPL